jgi:hypothetical protein
MAIVVNTPIMAKTIMVSSNVKPLKQKNRFRTELGLKSVMVSSSSKRQCGYPVKHSGFIGRRERS